MSTTPRDDELTRAPSAVAPSSRGEAPRPPSRDRYRLGTTLGEGGMAIVYEAEDRNLKRPVAIKELRKELSHDADARRRFFEEAEILASLDHPGLVAVHELGVLPDDRPFYAMAKVRGRTLADLLGADSAAGLRVSMRLVEIVQRTAETMGFAHGKGFVHRDLKPQNIMLDEDGAVYVMDWGIAKRMGAPDPGDEGVVMGTPSYMSPELASGQAQAADPRSDVFALGVILYEVLTGKRPFRADTALGVIDEIRRHTPDAPRAISRRVPRELSAICMKALAKDPSARYRSAREFASDLRDYRNFLPITAIQPRLRDRIGNWIRRHPRGSAVLGTALAALTLVGAVRTYRAVTDHLIADSLWTQYETTERDVEALELDVARADSGAGQPGGADPGRGDIERTERRVRLDMRRNDARSLLTALLGLTLKQPDARVLAAMSGRMRGEVDRALAERDYVTVKVLAETRLEIIRQLEGKIAWPPDDIRFLRAALEHASAELER